MEVTKYLQRMFTPRLIIHSFSKKKVKIDKKFNYTLITTMVFKQNCHFTCFTFYENNHQFRN